jgi:hypothetical protein
MLRKPGAKGQSIVIDLFAAVLLFLLIAGTLSFAWSSKSVEAENRLLDNEASKMAEKAVDILLTGSGKPENWERESEAPQVIGLAKRALVLGSEKVNQFVWRSGLLERDLVSVWHFNGDAEDVFGNCDGEFKSGSGILPNAAGTGLWNGTALELEAANQQYVLVPNKAAIDISGEGITLSAWVNASSFSSGWHGILLKRTQGSYELWVYGNKPKCGLRIDGSLYRETANYELQPGTWHHLACSFDGQYMKIYVDGDEKASFEHEGSITADGKDLYIGYSGYSSEYFDGLIEEARIYERALEKEEILALQDWSESFVKQRLLSGSNDYYFRLYDFETGDTLKNPYGDVMESGSKPESGEKEITIRRPVSFEGGAAIAELVLHRTRVGGQKN